MRLTDTQLVLMAVAVACDDHSAADAMESFEYFLNEPLVRLASLMDHTPGQRQFTSLDAFRAYYLGRSGMSEAEIQTFIERRIEQADLYSAPQRQAIAALCHERGIVIVSHDDATGAHVAEAAELGVSLAEFPTTLEAAKASRDASMQILMGAPNIVRGGSHTGNIAACDLVTDRLLDVLSSDYFPFSLLHAVFKMAEDSEAISLPAGVAMVTSNPAKAAGLDDCGEIVIGKRADLAQVRVDSDVPLVRSVWRQGRRVT